MKAKFRIGAKGAVAYAAFTLTGLGTALLGALLPTVLTEWHLSYRGGGQLLLSAFGGSTVGAILARAPFRLTATAGLLLCGAAALGLSLLKHGSDTLFFAYGLGLGLAMTAISTYRAREATAEQRSAELNRLNFLWAAGACCAPVLALHSLHQASVHAIFLGVTALLLLAGLGLLLDWRTAPNVDFNQPQRLKGAVPWRFCLFAAAAAGAEGAFGSWLTTYVMQLRWNAGVAVTVNSAFWLGLLLSRAAHSFTVARWLRTVEGISVHLLALTAASVLLVLLPLGIMQPILALVAGFSLGPLYPWVLSWVLPHYRSSLIFVMAGLGAAIFPWLTGVVSSSQDSLRAGMLLPWIAIGILLVTAWRIATEMREDYTP